MLITQSTLLSGTTNMVAGTLASSKIHLYKAFTGASNPTPSDFTESAYSGYADQSVVFEGPRIYDNQNVGQSFTNLFAFSNPGSGASAPESVLGYYVTDTADTHVHVYGQFPNPISMSSPDSMFNLIGQFQLNPSLSVGVEVVA